jgi:MSHA pilin protein MshC
MKSRHPHRYAPGFTVIELVVVIVIIGILAAVAGPRFFSDRTFLERGYYEELAAALKYAQKLAVATGCSVRMQITAGTLVTPGTYVAQQQAASGGSCDTADTTWATQVQLADGEVLSGTSPLGVTATAATIVFDALGRTNLAANQVINVGPYALTVGAASGYVQAP